MVQRDLFNFVDFIVFLKFVRLFKTLLRTTNNLIRSETNTGFFLKDQYTPQES